MSLPDIDCIPIDEVTDMMKEIIKPDVHETDLQVYNIVNPKRKTKIRRGRP